MNAIEKAVSPLKEMAIARSVAAMEKRVAEAVKALEEANWDAQIVAPYPKSNCSRGEYQARLAYYNFIRSITNYTKATRRMNEPEIRVYDEVRVKVLLQKAREFAAAEYESYVAKLNAKIGEVEKAELLGNSVWNYSILVVTKKDGTVERWKTQIIVNVSSLGKLFNQWPTRKMK